MRLLLILLFGIWGANAATHTLQYFFTATTGITNFPRLVDVGMLNGEPISMYDSTSQKKIPKQKWMAENLDYQYWNSGTEMRKARDQVFFANIQILMSRFNQTAGVHTNQRLYGCEWDDETGAINGFFQDGYDGEDFLHLDLKDLTWITPVPQGFLTIQKWNNNRAQLDYWKQYLSTECIQWLKKYLQYGKSSLEKTVSPQVSLLQKDPSSPVTCHATGFYPSGVTISWMKNGQDHDEDVDLSELLPNEDGTFQRKSTIRVTPDERKNNEFSCVVEHQGKTIREILTDDSVPIGIIIGAVVAVILLVVSGVIGYKMYQKKKDGKKDFEPVNGSENGSNSENA